MGKEVKFYPPVSACHSRKHYGFSRLNLGTAFAIYSDMTNAKNTIKTSNGNSVMISSETDNRIKSVAWSDGAAMILAKSCSARDELVTYYRAWGLNVDTCDRKGLTVWA